MSNIFIDPIKKAEIDKQIELKSVDDWFSDQISLGFTTSYDWKLGLKDTDITLLTGAFVLAKQADEMGLPLPQIVDTDGIPHSMNLIEITQLMLAYGHYRAELSVEYANRKEAALNT
jgi:hypothetical protein